MKKHRLTLVPIHIAMKVLSIEFTHQIFTDMVVSINALAQPLNKTETLVIHILA